MLKRTYQHAPAQRSTRARYVPPQDGHLLWQQLPQDIITLLVALVDPGAQAALRYTCRTLGKKVPAVRARDGYWGIQVVAQYALIVAFESDNPRYMRWLLEECCWFRRPTPGDVGRLVFAASARPSTVRAYLSGLFRSRSGNHPSYLAMDLAAGLVKHPHGLACLKEIHNMLDYPKLFRKALKRGNTEVMSWALLRCPDGSYDRKSMQQIARGSRTIRMLANAGDIRVLDWLWENSVLALGIKHWSLSELLQVLAEGTCTYGDWLLARFPRAMRSFLRQDPGAATLSHEITEGLVLGVLFNRHISILEWCLANGATRFDYAHLLQFCPEGHVDTDRIRAWLMERLGV